MSEKGKCLGSVSSLERKNDNKQEVEGAEHNCNEKPDCRSEGTPYSNSLAETREENHDNTSAEPDEQKIEGKSHSNTPSTKLDTNTSEELLEVDTSAKQRNNDKSAGDLEVNVPTSQQGNDIVKVKDNTIVTRIDDAPGVKNDERALLDVKPVQSSQGGSDMFRIKGNDDTVHLAGLLDNIEEIHKAICRDRDTNRMQTLIMIDHKMLFEDSLKEYSEMIEKMNAAVKFISERMTWIVEEKEEILRSPESADKYTQREESKIETSEWPMVEQMKKIGRQLEHIAKFRKKSSSLEEYINELRNAYYENCYVAWVTCCWLNQLHRNCIQETEDPFVIPDKRKGYTERTNDRLLKLKGQVEGINERQKQIQCQLRKTSESYDRLTTEREELLLRLSKVAGAKLTEGNASISDLSDPDRPIKLAETYSELYDNQWTDAFDQLSKRSEEDRIALLLEILKESYNVSEWRVGVQWKRIVDAFTMTENQDQDKGLKEIGFHMTELKDLKSLRKLAASNSVKEHLKQGIQELKQTFGKETVRTIKEYAKACLQITWSMVLHDPPLRLFHDFKKRKFCPR